ncbi:HD-GYP domain-containing protein [Allostreptomyces psammosilenae]|uniref:HD-GYP domain-containing protein n=1 Tax=Allostreptomyces psammosilenae TaxID=1892865 RepID=A0A853A6X6_9ACTN|nr:HD-GYP domain-containing protein [Allostreptomyces psammosilenae]NYI06298.1 hypothetical protein [Allostreptomyces psammosilenae]
MRTLPFAARCYVALVTLAAALLLVPLALSAAHALDVPAAAIGGAPRVDWFALAVLVAFNCGYVLCAQVWPASRTGRRDAEPAGDGVFFPVLLAAALLLPANAAAAVAIPGALLQATSAPRTAKRVWNAAQLAVCAFCAAVAFHHLDGPALLDAADFPAVLLPALAATAVFCLVNAVLVGAILVAAEHRAPRTAWLDVAGRTALPYLVHGAVGLTMAVLWRGPFGAYAVLLTLLPLYVAGWALAQSHRERAAHAATVQALVKAVEIKDHYTRGHSERVGRAAVMIAHELGMPQERVTALHHAGVLHDIGKICVPTGLLRKNGPLTPEEQRVVRLHPEYGDEIVSGIDFLAEARAGILHHHERMDGSGYPLGLRGGEVPEFARVIAVADSFDAMTSTRSYRGARPAAAAVAELRRCAGTQFDPRMVDALVRALARQGWDGVPAAELLPAIAPPPRPADPAGPMTTGQAPAGASPGTAPVTAAAEFAGGCPGCAPPADQAPPIPEQGRPGAAAPVGGSADRPPPAGDHGGRR